MKIIIPMSGQGKRFQRAGYTSLKPLIYVDGKPILEYVIKMFPGEHEFVFICDKNHIQDTNMKEVIESLAPGSIIVPINSHSKGPVYAILQAFEYIKDDEDVFISYCDYYMEWDFIGALQKIKEGNYDGAVPSYRGFHPHLLHKNLYGGVLTDGKGTMLDYKEKHSFTENPQDSFHSAGAYYFRRGDELKKYTQELLDSNIRIGDEAYVSMIYYLYLRDNKKIYVPEITRFMQWGTPEDLEEYEAWSRYFHDLFGKEKKESHIPKSREGSIKIPYDRVSEAFEKCYTYWEKYFNK